MKSEFQTRNINSLCSLISSGGTPSRSRDDYYQNGNIKWLKTKELFDTNIYETEEHITELGLKNSSAKLYPSNTVVMAMYGATVGQLGVMKTEMSTNQACCCMVVNDQIADYRYLFYSLLNNRNELIGLANGAAQQNLNSQTIKDFEILVPSFQTQKKIAHILSTLDDKIELNRKMNQTLEEMASAIFKSWFVDFDPVHAKAKCQNESDLVSVAKELGISKEILDLFPSEFEESELGMIPKGWEVYSLEKVSSLSAGGDKPKNTTETKTTINKIPIYSNGIKDEGLYGFTDTPKILEESVTISARGTIGFICLRFEPYVPIVRLISVVPDKNYLSSKYLFFWLKNQNINGFGTTQQQLTIPVFKQEKIMIPPFALMNNFSKTVDIIYNKIQNNSSETKTLQKTRDTLLPKLLSGEIDVSEMKI